MKERPILFDDAMVRAILADAKTQTRRPLLVGGASVHHMRTEGGWKRLDPHDDSWVYLVERDARGGVVRCPFGVPGDTLWVRECFATCRHAEMHPRCIDYRADFAGDVAEMRWKPSIHMPRWASRLTLRVTNVRVERLQDISEEDAEREGFLAETIGYMQDAHGEVPIVASARGQFESTWTGVYGPESWTANPWVWVVSFEREVQR